MKDKKNNKKIGWTNSFSFNMLAGTQPTQKLESENLHTGETVRIIDGVRYVGLSIGSHSVENIPENVGVFKRSSLPTQIRSFRKH